MLRFMNFQYQLVIDAFLYHCYNYRLCSIPLPIVTFSRHVLTMKNIFTFQKRRITWELALINGWKLFIYWNENVLSLGVMQKCCPKRHAGCHTRCRWRRQRRFRKMTGVRACIVCDFIWFFCIFDFIRLHDFTMNLLPTTSWWPILG